MSIVLIGILMPACTAKAQEYSGENEINPVNFLNVTPTFGTGHDYLKILNESVNPANGAVSIHIAIPTPKGRGITFPYSINYNSGSAFTLGTPPVNLSSLYMSENGSSSGGWSDSLPLLSASDAMAEDPESGDTCSWITDFVFTDMSGAQHTLPLVDVVGDNVGGEYCGGLPYSTINSGSDRIVQAANTGGTTANIIVSAQDGTVYSFYAIPGGGSQVEYATPELIEDRNGNEITASWNNASTLFKDTLGRTVLDISGRGISPADGLNSTSTSTTISIAGIPQPYTATWENAPATFVPSGQPDTSTPNTSCPVPYFVQGSPSPQQANEVINKLILPDGTYYAFTYDPVYGLLSKITYPNGAYVQYTWGTSGMSDDAAYRWQIVNNEFGDNAAISNYECHLFYSWPAVTERQVSFDGIHVALEQDFSYSTKFSTGSYNLGWYSKTTTVVTHDLLRGISYTTIYTYAPDENAVQVPFTTFADIGTRISGYPPEETSVEVEDASGSPIQTTNESWYDSNHMTSHETILNTNQTSEKTYTYTWTGQNGGVMLPEEEDDYGYGSGAPGPLMRKVITSYANFATSPNAALMGYPTLLNFPSKVVVEDGSGNEVAETDYAYDQNISSSPTGIVMHDSKYEDSTGESAPRGDITTVTHKCLQGCSDSVWQYAYDDTGQVVSAIDPNGNPTSYGWSDDFTSDDGTPSGQTNAYLTSLTDPTVNGIQIKRTFSYGFNDGQVRSETDVSNNETTTYCHYTGGCSGSTFDPWFRLTEVDYPGGGWKKASYVDSGSNPYTILTQAISGSTTKTATTILDGLGHVVQTQLTSAPQGTVYVDTTYDGMGNVYTRSNPYRTTSDPTYGITTYSYDALGRKLSVTHPAPDNSKTTWSYNGNVVTYTDENGNEWQRTYDALGRLVEVEEPNGSSQAPSMETDYSYDALGDLLRVDQWGGPSGGSGDRVRTFSYDSLGRLLSASNPESGTVSYTYDADGNVLTKTDARGVTTNYKYDALNRLLSKTYSAGTSADPTDTPVSCYEYDTSSSAFSGFSPTNLVGRLSNEWTQPSGKSCSSSPESGNYITLDAFSYDPMGRVLTEEQCTPANCTASTPYNMTYTYDLAGDVTSSTNGLATTPGSSGAPLTFTYAWNGAQWLQGITSNWSTTNPAYPPQLMSVGSFIPTGAVSAMTYGNGLSLTRTYDNRLRITGETDQGSVRASATPGTATITISGSDQSQ